MFDEKTLKEFREPLTAHKLIGTNYKYAKISEVIDKLNRAFDYSWSSEIVNIEQKDRFVLCHVVLKVVDSNNLVVYKHGVGGSEVKFKKNTKDVLDLAKDYASAFASALKQAAKQFGIRVGDEGNSQTSYNNRSNYNSNKPTKPSNTEKPKKNRPPMDPTPSPLPSRSTSNKRKISSSELVEQTMKNMDQPKTSSVVVQSKKPTTTVSNVVKPSGDISPFQEKALRAISSRLNVSPLELIKRSIGNTEKTAFLELNKSEASKVINYGNTIVWENEDKE